MRDSTLQVLIVEDNAADALILRKVLEECSAPKFALFHVKQLCEGLERLKKNAFDVILLDLGLPDSQGLATFTAVREQAPNSAIILLTGTQDESLATHTLQQGAQDYLVKGRFSADDLPRTIRYALERKRAHEKLVESARLGALASDVSDALVQGGTLPEMLERCATALVKHLGEVFARIWLLNPAENVLELRAGAGIPAQTDGAQARVPMGQFKVGKIAEERLPYFTNDVIGDPGLSDEDWALREGMVSFAGYPLLVEGRVMGVMTVFARHALSPATVTAMCWVAGHIALGIQRKRADEEKQILVHDLRERVKELTLLHEMGRIVQAGAPSVGELLSGIAAILPPAWQYSEIAEARAVFDVTQRFTPGFRRTPWMQTAEFSTSDGRTGAVEIAYLEERPTHADGPFLREERELIQSVAEMLRGCLERETSQRGLRESEALLVRAQKIAGMGYWQWDLATDDVAWSDQIYRIFDLDPYAFQPSYSAFMACVHPDDRTAIQDAVRATLDTGAPYSVDHRVIRPDGTVIAVNEQAEIIRAGDGTPVRFLGTVLDITARTRGEDAVRESERQYRQLAASLPQLVWTWLPDGECDFISPQWREYTGTSESENLGSGWLDRLHADDRLGARDDWIAARREKRDIFESEFRIRAADGSYRWFMTRGSAIRNDARELVKWFGTCTDMDNERRAREEASRLAAIVENSDDAIIGTDINGLITSWNSGATRVYGYTAEEIVGKSAKILSAPDRSTELDQLIDDLRNGKRISHFETRRVCKDGRMIGVSLTISPVVDRGGTMTGLAAISRDITARNLADAALRLSEERYRSLVKATSSVIWTTDAAGVSATPQESWEAFTGQTWASTPVGVG